MVLGVLAATVSFAQRVSHVVTVDQTGPGEYAVSGQLFFASSNDLVYSFDYGPGTDKVSIDFSAATLWDTSTIAAVDAVRSKYASRGIEVEFKGLDDESQRRIEKFNET